MLLPSLMDVLEVLAYRVSSAEYQFVCMVEFSMHTHWNLDREAGALCSSTFDARFCRIAVRVFRFPAFSSGDLLTLYVVVAIPLFVSFQHIENMHAVSPDTHGPFTRLCTTSSFVGKTAVALIFASHRVIHPSPADRIQKSWPCLYSPSTRRTGTPSTSWWTCASWWTLPAGS